MGEAFESEIEFWKVPNFIKDMEEINSIKQLMK